MSQVAKPPLNLTEKKRVFNVGNVVVLRIIGKKTESNGNVRSVSLGQP